MSLREELKQSHPKSNENIKKFFSSSQKTMGPPRQSFTVLQTADVNVNLGKMAQKGKVKPKRKHLPSQASGPKRGKVEVKATQTDDASHLTDGISEEAYELMVKETPPSTYWKEVAEERRLALYNVLQENERLIKDIEARDEQISKLQSENEELQELAQHVQYMADMIERLTGKSPNSLEELKEIALDADNDVGAQSDEEGLSDHSDAEFSD
ncbi:geminin [Gouania willdenowi]|uniref:Geminin n=1 Tax=Gouania willdenowi TaxID=441366 RepID=A0A8C5DIB0_GOUWI|nr:geminin [Gouania willdenowi]